MREVERKKKITGAPDVPHEDLLFELPEDMLETRPTLDLQIAEGSAMMSPQTLVQWLEVEPAAYPLAVKRLEDRKMYPKLAWIDAPRALAATERLTENQLGPEDRSILDNQSSDRAQEYLMRLGFTPRTPHSTTRAVDSLGVLGDWGRHRRFLRLSFGNDLHDAVDFVLDLLEMASPQLDAWRVDIRPVRWGEVVIKLRSPTGSRFRYRGHPNDQRFWLGVLSMFDAALTPTGWRAARLRDGFEDLSIIVGPGHGIRTLADARHLEQWED